MNPNKSEKILTAAYRLFRQHGFKKVTMSEIAAEAGISRPTLYAAFSSKEAVFGGLCARHADRAQAELESKLPRAKTLETRLSLIFEHWIIEPAASVLGTPNGLDLLANAAAYCPEAYDALYVRFEKHLTTLLVPAMKGRKRSVAARDLAHILTLATKGLKASATTLAELRRMTKGLIAMAVTTAQSER